MPSPHHKLRKPLSDNGHTRRTKARRSRSRADIISKNYKPVLSYLSIRHGPFTVEPRQPECENALSFGPSINGKSSSVVGGRTSSGRRQQRDGSTGSLAASKRRVAGGEGGGHHRRCYAPDKAGSRVASHDNAGATGLADSVPDRTGERLSSGKQERGCSGDRGKTHPDKTSRYAQLALALRKAGNVPTS